MHKHAKLFIYDNMLSMGAYWVCSGSVIAAMTNYYNIPLGPANMITGITATFTLLQIVGGLLFSKANNKVRFLYGTNFIWRMLLPVVFISVVFGQTVGTSVFVISYVLMVAFMQLTNPSQIAWSVNATEGKAGPNFFTMREMVFIFTHAILFFIAGIIVDASQRGDWEKSGFVYLGILLGVVIAVSIAVMLHLPTNSLRQTITNEQQKKQNKQKNSHVVIKVIKNKKFMAVLIASAFWNFSSMFANNFAAIYQVRMINMPFSNILVWSAAGLLIRAAIAPFVQGLAKNISWQRVVQLAVFVMLIVNIGWFFVGENNKYILYPFLAIGAAIPFAGITVGFLQMQVGAINKGEDKTVFFSVLATANGIFALLGSFLCSATIGIIEQNMPEGEVDLRIIFIIGILFMTITIISAQFIGQHKNIRANMLKQAIIDARMKYPHVDLQQTQKKKKKFNIFDLFK